jgi:hypothetical protein
VLIVEEAVQAYDVIDTLETSKRWFERPQKDGLRDLKKMVWAA